MLRVRHILNNETIMKFQFRNYFAEASRIEVPDNAEVTEKFENVGKWVCTFSCPPLPKGEIKTKVVIISSKKKLIKEFRKFILSNFVLLNQSKKQTNNNIRIVESTNLVIDDILMDVRNLRKAINEKDPIKVNTLIEDAVLALNALQTKLSELGEFDADKKDK